MRTVIHDRVDEFVSTLVNMKGKSPKRCVLYVEALDRLGVRSNISSSSKRMYYRSGTARRLAAYSRSSLRN